MGVAVALQLPAKLEAILLREEHVADDEVNTLARKDLVGFAGVPSVQEFCADSVQGRTEDFSVEIDSVDQQNARWLVGNGEELDVLPDGREWCCAD